MHQRQLRDQYFTQTYFNMQARGARDQTSNVLIGK